MPDLKISQLPAAAALDGTEEVPIAQAGDTVKTTTQDIADLGGGGGLSTDIVDPSDGQVLCFRGADSKWVNDARLIGKSATPSSGDPGQDVLIRSGDGDVSGDYAGKLTIQSGDGTSGSYAGRLYIQGGTPYGFVRIRSGGGNADYNTAGDLQILTANGYGATGQGGYLRLKGGDGAGTGVGGSLRIESGSSGEGGVGSRMIMNGGSGTSGGGFTMTGGNAANPAGSGGSFNIYAGSGTGAGGYSGGQLQFRGGDGNNYAPGGSLYMRGGFSSSADGGSSKISTGASAFAGAHAGHLYLEVGVAVGGATEGIIYINKAGNTTKVVANLPTSAAGLPSGALWNNSGVVNIV